MIPLFELIIELHCTEEFNCSLAGRAEEELKSLCEYVNPHSQTAQAYRENFSLTNIILAAQEDLNNYGIGAYYAVVDLAIAFQNACWRWSENERNDPEQTRPMLYPPAANEEQNGVFT